MEKYVIGMDGGGTKTEVQVADCKQNNILRFQGGAINYNGQSKSIVDSNIQVIFERIIADGFDQRDCVGICIGAAGTSNPSVRTQIMESIEKFGYECPITIVGDEETAFVGALERTPGVILIAGTGSICYGSDSKGNTFRSGGYGHIIDDPGSGYAVARDILSAMVRGVDGRGEPTVLTKLVFQHLNITCMEELIGYLYSPGRSKKEIAQLSFLIQEAYALGDLVAEEIVKKTATDLTDLVTPVINKLGEETKLAVSGSILIKNEDIYREFVDQMKKKFPRTVIMKPRQDAACGAVLLALHHNLLP